MMATSLCITIGAICQLAFLCLATVHASNPSGVSATIGNAVFHGKKAMINSHHYYARFAGIRYGNASRFEKPAIITYSGGSWDAKELKYVCPQKQLPYWFEAGEEQSEDCLFLNIHVPLSASEYRKNHTDVSAPRPLKAVYIFIHGGHLKRGNGNRYKPVEMATSGDIIVVTINYRLDILGFMTTDDGAIPANLGLHDQHTAIKWVFNNIKRFGGDKSRVTIGGQSAGSYSVLLQAIYHKNDKYIRNVIAQSGSPLAHGVMKKKGNDIKILSNAFNCSSRNPGKSDLQCLKNIPFKDILTLAQALEKKQKLISGLVKDDDFITEEMFNIFSKNPGFVLNSHEQYENTLKTFSKKNLLIGFNSEEGDVGYAMIMKALKMDSNIHLTEQQQKAFFQSVLKIFLKLKYKTLIQHIADFILQQYNPKTKDTNETTSYNYALIHLITDLQFAVPILQTAKIHARTNQGPANNQSHGNTYVYRFTLQGKEKMASWYNLKWFQGTGHDIELKYLMEPNTLTDANRKSIRRSMIETWTNFVNTGDPSGKSGPKWKPFSGTEPNGTVYDLSGKIEQRGSQDIAKIKFWEQDLRTAVLRSLAAKVFSYVQWMLLALKRLFWVLF